MKVHTVAGIFKTHLRESKKTYRSVYSGLIGTIEQRLVRENIFAGYLKTSLIDTPILIPDGCTLLKTIPVS